MAKVKQMFECSFTDDLMYQGIKFLIYDFYTTKRGELRKGYLLGQIRKALQFFYKQVGYNRSYCDKLTNESLNIIKEQKDFEGASSLILTNNTVNCAFASLSK